MSIRIPHRLPSFPSTECQEREIKTLPSTGESLYWSSAQFGLKANSNYLPKGIDLLIPQMLDTPYTVDAPGYRS